MLENMIIVFANKQIQNHLVWAFKSTFFPLALGLIVRIILVSGAEGFTSCGLLATITSSVGAQRIGIG